MEEVKLTVSGAAPRLIDTCLCIVNKVDAINHRA